MCGHFVLPTRDRGGKKEDAISLLVFFEDKTDLRVKK